MMKKIFPMMLLCATVLFASCKDDDNTTEVSGISIDPTTLTLEVGKTATLTAAITPKDANTDLRWSTSSAAIASVDESGVVTAVAVGDATITVTTVEGGKTATCKVTVVADKVAVTGVSLNKTTTSIGKGGTEKLVATIAPTDATDQTVTWESSNAAIATVATDGTVTAVEVGTATITVKTTDGEKTATCVVTVTPTFENEGKPGIDGSSWEKAYEIKTKEQLVLLSERVGRMGENPWKDKYYKLTADIDFGDSNTEQWTPIGGMKEANFRGHFDGGNHTIKGKLTFYKHSNTLGIFGVVTSGVIKNLHFKGTYDMSQITETKANFGGIVGQIGNGTILNCTNTASISTDKISQSLGGIVGKIEDSSKVIACVNSGNINNAASNFIYVGGIAGRGDYGYVIGCTNKGNATSVQSSTGGIVGYGTSTACWSNAISITSSGSKGGIIGLVSSEIGATASYCYWKVIAGINGASQGGGELTNSASFTGDKPDATQIASMNTAWASAQPDGREYQFNATTGEIEKMPR